MQPFETLGQSLINEINKHPRQLEFGKLRIEFYIKEDVPYYRVFNGYIQPEKVLESPLSFQQISLDLKSIGAFDSNALVFYKQIGKLFSASFSLIIKDFINARVNVDTEEVLKDSETTATYFDFDSGNDTFLFQVEIQDPVNSQTFENVLSVTKGKDFSLDGFPTERGTEEQPPRYILLNKFNTDMRH